MAKVARVWTGSEWVVLSPAAINPYPSQSGNSGKVLQTDGASVSWNSLYSAIDNIGNISISGDLSLIQGGALRIGGALVLSATQYAGNSSTVTNGVVTTGSYTDPSWIVSLPWSKITSTPSTISGYGITDAQPLNITLTKFSSNSNVANTMVYFNGNSETIFSSTTLTEYARNLISSIDAPTARTTLNLGNVENSALSTFSGSNNIISLGTITSGTWTATPISASYIDSSIARLSSPTFTGNVLLPSTTTIGDVSSTEISYLDGVTSAIQTQLNEKLASTTASSTYAPLASPTFTGTVSFSGATVTGINLLPSQTSNSGKFLTTDGSAASWSALPAFATEAALGVLSGTVDGKASISGATFTGFVTLHSNPTNALHAVTKQYVDDVAEGLKTKPSVEIATTANLVSTYNNGTSGVGATLTATSNGAFPEIDGITLSSIVPGQNGVLVKNQTNSAHNGRYNLTQVGSASLPWILTRCGLCDQASEIPGSYTFVKRGTVNSGSGWVQIVSNPTTFVLGTDSIICFQFSGAGTITAGTNISVTGTQVSTVSNPTFSGLITATSGVAFSDGTQTKQGVPSISTFISKTASYTLDDLTLRDNIIEVNSASATTVTIPPDSSLNFPVGSSLDVIQINTGEVTIAAGAGVTINFTPGLKLRTQWSSCTVLKRAANSWIVYGDLKA